MSQDSQTAYKVVLEARKEAISILKNRMGFGIGRVIVDIDASLSDEQTENEIILENGDQIYVPKKSKSVYLIGGVAKSASILYKEREGLHYYVKQSGGYSKYADRSGIIIIKPDGTVSQRVNDISMGDTIYIPEMVKIDINWLKFITNISDILFKTASVISTLKILQGG